MLFKRLKKRICIILQRKFCEHQYQICALSDVHVSFKCKRCGKEIVVPLRRGPIDLLNWGYGWYHHNPTEETIQLLIYQGISKNNELIVPQKEVFIISYIEKMDVEYCNDMKGRRIDLGDIRTKGIYFEEKKAKEALCGNIADCYYKDYPFASMECYGSGQANLNRRIAYFRYDPSKRMYTEYDPPMPIRRDIRTVATGLVK